MMMTKMTTMHHDAHLDHDDVQVPSLPANFGVKKLLSGEPASPLVNDTMSVASGYSTVTGQIIGPAVIARWTIFDVLVVNAWQ